MSVEHEHWLRDRVTLANREVEKAIADDALKEALFHAKLVVKYISDVIESEQKSTS